MNTNLKMLTLAIVAASSLTTAAAQKEKKEKSEKRNQRITIIRNDDDKDSAEKMTIVVDGDKITINGKPADEYKDADVKVITGDQHFRVIAPRPPRAPRTPRVPMAIAGMNGDVFSWNANAAVLGVSTEDGEGGAKITSLIKDGAAEKAGLKTGDIITKVNEYNVADADDLPMAIQKFKPEDKVTINYKRDGKEQTATATLQKNEHGFANSFAFGDHDFDFNFDQGNVARTFTVFGRPRLGLQIEDLEEGSGVKVLDVNDDAPAAKAGLKKDDVITSFNGKEIKSVDDIRTAMKDVKPGETIKIIYNRGGSSQNAEIKFPKPVKKASL